MNIGIDCRMYGPHNGGIGRYIEQLVKHLLIIDPDNEYTFFVHPNNPLPSFSQPHHIVEIPARWYTLQEQTIAARIMNTSNVRFIHFPHWNVPLLITKPFITTIHDLILLHHPNRKASTLPTWKYRLKYAAFKLILKNAVLRSQHILTVSEFSKQDIIKNLNINSQYITTTHLGITPPTPLKMQSPHTNPYMLMVGVHYPHKNHQLILDFFPTLTNPLIQQWDLIIAGPRGPFTNELKEKIEISNKQSQHKTGSIILIENATDQTLNQLYQHAQIFLFPSLYEGFGIPPLEAMTHGTPVIASNKSSIPEVCAQAALLCNPNEPNEWKNAIELLALNPHISNMYSSYGYIRTHNFSWNACAQKTLATYKKHFS